MILYKYQPDELPNGPGEDSDHWWSGTQKSFASIALAAALVFTAASTAVAVNIVRDVEEIPANTLKGQPEEYYWQNPAATQQLVFTVPQQSSFQQDETFFFPDEDYWQNEVPPIAASMWQRLPLGDFEDAIPHAPTDEDFWINPAPPIAASMWQRLPIGDVEELPQLFGPEEDYALALRQAPFAFTYPQPWAFDGAEFVSIVDEDFWTAPGPQIWGNLRYAPPDDDFAIAESVEEEYWQNQVAPIPLRVYQSLPYQPDAEEIPAGSLSTIEEESWLRLQSSTYPFIWPQQFNFDAAEFVSMVDEDAWQSPIFAPSPWIVPQQFVFDYDETQTTLALEEEWKQSVQVLPSTVYPQPWSFDNQELPSLAFEEDGWQAKPWAQASAPLIPVADDDFVQQAIADEDYWFRPYAAMQQANILPVFAAEEFAYAASGGAKLVIWIGEEVS